MLHPSLSLLRAKLVAVFAALSLAPIAASASVLMLDFGPTTVTGDDQTNSPYHSVDATFTGTFWNQIQTANPSSLVYSDGSAATGVTLTLGASNNSTLVNFAQTPSHTNALGTQIASGVFSNTSVGKDGIYNGTVASHNNLVALKIGGLSAGTYEIYVVGLNTNTLLSGQTPSNFYAAATGDIATFDVNGLTPSTTTHLTSSAGVNAWTEGQSYGKITIDLAANEYLILVSDGATAAANRGFLNSVQVVAIPEPSTVVLGLAGCLSLIVLRRVSRRRAA